LQIIHANHYTFENRVGRDGFFFSRPSECKIQETVSRARTQTHMSLTAKNLLGIRWNVSARIKCIDNELKELEMNICEDEQSCGRKRLLRYYVVGNRKGLSKEEDEQALKLLEVLVRHYEDHGFKARTKDARHCLLLELRWGGGGNN
jgi:hypothetical protein